MTGLIWNFSVLFENFHDNFFNWYLARLHYLLRIMTALILIIFFCGKQKQKHFILYFNLLSFLFYVLEFSCRKNNRFYKRSMYGVYKLNSRMNNNGNSVPLDILKKISNDDVQSRISVTKDADKQINEICENCILVEEVYIILFYFIFYYS